MSIKSLSVKGVAVTAAAGLMLSSAAASADDYRGRGGRDIVYARVVSVQPLVRYVTVEQPRHECWEETRYRPAAPGRVAGTTLAGGIVGAAIGRQFGGGSGRDALTLLGAVAGSAVAHERATRRMLEEGAAVYAVPVQRCTTVSERRIEEVVDGYDVVYEYRGRRYSMRTAEHPGSRVPLQVSFRPVRF